MAQWKELPKEIVSQIAHHLWIKDQFQRFLKTTSFYLGDKRVDWYLYGSSSIWATNTQFYTYYISNSFKRLVIDFSQDLKTVEAILTSPFQPGQHVKKLELINVHPGHISGDLNRVIVNCPNVVEFGFDENAVDEWSYIYQAIADSNWSLKSLKEPANMNEQGTIYYKAASRMKNSLEKLTLSSIMVEKDGFNGLTAFAKLTDLTIGSDVFKTLLEFITSIQGLPHLQKLTVSNFQSMQMYNVEHVQEIILNRVKTLELKRYAPSSSEDLLFVTRCFARINQMHINKDRASAPCWPFDAIDSNAIIRFLEFAFNKVKKCSICIPSNGELSLIDAYWQAEKEIESDREVGLLSIEAHNHDMPANSSFVFDLKIDSEESIVPDMTWTFGNVFTQAPTIKRALCSLNGIIWDLEVDWVLGFEISDLFDAVMNSLNTTKMETIKMRHGVFLEYQSNGSTNRARSVNEVTLDEMDINTRTICPNLSLDFPKLGIINLWDCDILGAYGKNRVEMHMENTSLELLYFRGGNMLAYDTTILLEIGSVDQEFIRYYVFAEADIFAKSDHKAKEISQEEYESLKTGLETNRMVDLSLHFKSIKAIMITTREHDDHEIHCILPETERYFEIEL